MEAAAGQWEREVWPEEASGELTFQQGPGAGWGGQEELRDVRPGEGNFQAERQRTKACGGKQV